MGQLTINFPTISTATGENIDLKIIFETSSGSETWDSSANQIYIKNLGSFETSYNLNDLTLTTSFFKPVLIDIGETFAGLVFDSAGVIEPEATVELYRNNTLEFRGNIVEDSFVFSRSEKTIEFSVSPKTSDLNDQSLFDDDDTPLNPFGYTLGTLESLRKILADIYGTIEPGVNTANISIFDGWNLSGKPVSGSQVYFDGLKVENTYIFINDLFFEPVYGIRTLGDVLRHLASVWFAFTGLLPDGRAFFHQLFNFSSGNLQTIEKILDIEKQRPFSRIQYVKVKSGASGVYSNIPEYTQGSYTANKDRRLDITSAVLFYENYNGLTYSGVQAYDPTGGDFYWVYRAKNLPNVIFWADHGEALAILWLAYKGNFSKLQTETFYLSGLDYDFLKNFQYNGKNYQVIRLKKDFDNLKTEIEALIV